MGLESFNFIDNLNSAWPTGSNDDVGEGDEHIRGIKTTLKNTFGNANRKYWLGGQAERSDKTRAVTGTYTVVYADGLESDNGRLLIANSADGAVTILLPAVANAEEGFLVSVTKGDANIGSVSVVPAGTENINGLNQPWFFNTIGETYHFWCTGAAWRLLSSTYPKSYSTTIADATKTLTVRDHGSTFLITNPACVVTMPTLAAVGDGFFVNLLAPGSGYYQVNRAGSDVFSNGVTTFRNYGTSSKGGHSVCQKIWASGGAWRRSQMMNVMDVAVPATYPETIVEHHYLGTRPSKFGFYLECTSDISGFNNNEWVFPYNSQSVSFKATLADFVLQMRSAITLIHVSTGNSVTVTSANFFIRLWGEI